MVDGGRSRYHGATVTKRFQASGLDGLIDTEMAETTERESATERDQLQC